MTPIAPVIVNAPVTLTAKYHPYQIALDNGEAAFNCYVIQGLEHFLYRIALMRRANER